MLPEGSTGKVVLAVLCALGFWVLKTFFIFFCGYNVTPFFDETPGQSVLFFQGLCYLVELGRIWGRFSQNNENYKSKYGIIGVTSKQKETEMLRTYGTQKGIGITVNYNGPEQGGTIHYEPHMEELKRATEAAMNDGHGCGGNHYAHTNQTVQLRTRMPHGLNAPQGYNLTVYCIGDIVVADGVTLPSDMEVTRLRLRPTAADRKRLAEAAPARYADDMIAGVKATNRLYGNHFTIPNRDELIAEWKADNLVAA